jgi:hypothetical protein
MKKLISVLLLTICTFISNGQTVNAPESKSFSQNTTNQDASGFTLEGFNSTDVLLTSISLINPPTGTTFFLNTTSGLTAAVGFTLTGNKTRIVVTGTMYNINVALSSLKINTGSAIGNVQLSVAATVNPTGYYYNGVNGHFYKPVSVGAYYSTAKLNAHSTTFKGQEGYLLTLTSANEEDFIKLNVPQSNIWFAATDKVVDGRWVIDDGPELGTVMKTTNSATGNIPGVYNNWCGGEPNGSNHSEDYPVAKWNGAPCWNDLHGNYFNPYVIEYGTWTNPDDATFTEFYTNSVSHSNGEVLRAQFNVDFGGNVDETKFSAKVNTNVNNTWGTTTNVTRTISGLGKVDVSNDLDTSKTGNGTYKALTSQGQVEWCIINSYDANLGGHRVSIDQREFDGTGVSPSDITSIKLFDIYDGPVTVNDINGWWKTYLLPGDLTNKILTTSYSSSLRLQGDWYGTSAEFTFTPASYYKQHGFELFANSQNELNTLYNNIVTVTDVYLAFKELSNGGLFGNESGNEFTSGIQYMNADVDGNGIFNESDTYKLLQHLMGTQPISQYTSLTYLMKLYGKTEYDGITKSNWNTQYNSSRSLLPFNLNTGILNNTYNVNVTWVGDVNLSHSAHQSTNGIVSNSTRTMSLKTNSVTNEINASVMGELIGGKVVITISLDPLQQEVVGTQFQLNYDNTSLKFEKVEFSTKGTPTNFGTNRGSSITLGSLITNGLNTLDKTTEYKITFQPLIGTFDILGLTSISSTDAVNKNGTQLKVKLN